MSQSLNPARLEPRRVDRTPTTARGLGIGGIVAAVLLHAALIGATLIAFQHPLEIADEAPPTVTVDLVTIADKTNVAPTVDRTVKPVPKDDVKPAPPLPVPVPTPAPTPPPAAEPAPAPPAPKPVTAPAPAPSPKPVEAKPAPAPAAKPQAKPAKPDQKKKPKTDSVDDLLNGLLSKPAATPARARPDKRTVAGVGAMNAATMDLVDAIRNAMAQCWAPTDGAPRHEDVIVDFDLFLNRDGSVAQPPQLTADSAARAARNPYTRAAAEAARRAIIVCAPYKLPADRYSQWSEINPFHFDPKDMPGQ